jgi:serine/threonine protein phosphatase PrpC
MDSYLTKHFPIGRDREMIVETLYDSGTAKITEDIAIINPPFFGVADGVSGIYQPDIGPETFDGLTGGQMAVKKLQKIVMLASPSDDLASIICEANKAIGRKNKEAGISAKEVERMAGATFVLAKIEKQSAIIIQGGDCFAIWANGQTGITPNQTFSHDSQCRELIAELMTKHKCDRAKMWQEFMPHLTQLRRKHTNNHHDPAGYCLLNGQKEMENFWNRFFVRNPSLLLLATDGLFQYAQTGYEDKLLRKTIELYRQKGLRTILSDTRSAEEKEKAKSHTDFAEATAVAITF